MFTLVPDSRKAKCSEKRNTKDDRDENKITEETCTSTATTEPKTPGLWFLTLAYFNKR